MEETVEFRKTIELLIKGKKIIIICSIITLLIAYIITWFYLEEKFESRAVIQLSSNAQDSGIMSDYVAHEFSIDVYLQRVKNETLINSSFKEKNMGDFHLSNLKAENPVNTNLIELSYRNTKPEDAQKDLELILKVTSGSMDEAIKNTLFSLEKTYLKESEDISKEIQKLMNQYNAIIEKNNLPEVLILQTISSSQFVIELTDNQIQTLKNINGVLQNELLQLKAQIDTNSEEYTNVLGKYQSVKTGLNSFSAENFIRVIVEPTSSEAPVTPNKPLNLLIGTFIGFLLGIGIVLFRDFWRDSAKTKTQ